MHGSSVSGGRLEFLAVKRNAPGHAVRVSAYHLGVVGWSVLDCLSAFLIVLMACWLSPAYDFWFGTIPADPNFSPVRIAAGYALLLPMISHVFGLHNPLMRREKSVLFVKYFAVATLAITLIAFLELMLFYTRVGRHVLLYAFALSGLGIPSLRLVLWRLSEERKRRVVVLGPAEAVKGVQTLIRSCSLPYELVPAETLGRLLRPGIIKTEAQIGTPGHPADLWQGCNVDEIVACYSEYTPHHEIARLSQALLAGIQVSDYGNFIERTFFRVPVEQISPEWFFQLNTSGDYALYRATKRMADLLLAAIGLILAAPLLLLMALLIKLESRGPAFYSQVRVGQFGRVFKIWKLRSMRNDAETGGAQWASKNDARVTRVGRILRRTRFDEVPQFFNVLRGEMSFIGPRPERPEFVQELNKTIPFYQQRHLLKPGITGWAQINYPYGSTPEDALNKLTFDFYYVKHASLLLDIQIVLRTVGAVMKGAR